MNNDNDRRVSTSDPSRLVEQSMVAQIRNREATKMQLEELSDRVSVIEIAQGKHMIKTQTAIDNSRELLDTFNALKGAWIVLNGIGKLAKPVTAILTLGGAWWYVKDHMKDIFK